MNVSTRQTTTFSSREFNQNTAGAKRAAVKGPVIVTDRGKPAFVLMSIEEYRKLEKREPERKKPMSLREALVDQIHGDDIDFDFPELKDGLFKGFEFD